MRRISITPSANHFRWIIRQPSSHAARGARKMGNWFAASKALVLATIAISAACSDATGTGDQLAGDFAFTILFDERPAAQGNGIITLEQHGTALTITGSFAATPFAGTFNAFRDGTVDADSIRFRVDASYPWHFAGAVSADRKLITGRHTLVGGGLSGRWSATKRSGGGPIPPP